jgi:hypothetical protein
MFTSFSALSLAGNIVQFFDFTCNVIELSKEICDSDDGASSQAIELHEVYSSLKRISVDLEHSWTSATLATGQKKEEKDLHKLAKSCQGICSEILTAIEETKLQPGLNQRKWNSFKQALRTVWKKKEIEHLEERLERLQKELTFGLTWILQ